MILLPLEPCLLWADLSFTRIRVFPSSSVCLLIYSFFAMISGFFEDQQGLLEVVLLKLIPLLAFP